MDAVVKAITDFKLYVNSEEPNKNQTFITDLWTHMMHEKKKHIIVIV